MNFALRIALAGCTALALAGCNEVDPDADRPETSREFPRAHRPVSNFGGNSVGPEMKRDERGEAQLVMDLADIDQGTTVADIGAGEGYYTVRLAERVGRKGRVLAQDIDRDALRRLGTRVERERLDNVSINLGNEDDPRLPESSFDRVFMIHMYHEIIEPYSFLWRLRPALREGGQVIVVDVDRPPQEHGMPPALLFCEMRSVGYRLVEFIRKPEIRGYYAQFELEGDRPAAAEIVPCKPQPTKVAGINTRDN
ncbi:class I SAM-dependent methyltransferase [Pseudoblastomonas halimionae]|uniref:Methyltransferase domain-containing protein n=1 Tax=Alteriqipengyuania halimionae TaxID=1926630 RepID=A0A6I4U4Q6_9SPHN|nr:class I SAM-dependent methyltransferase [Alteriqipengyuania halimionae]MXP09421.1 methyltransferase domain-containing protein [Alteriqipengyuania halimionae]